MMRSIVSATLLGAILLLCQGTETHAFRSAPDVRLSHQHDSKYNKSSSALRMSQVDEDFKQNQQHEAFEIEVANEGTSPIIKANNNKKLILGLAVGSLASVAVAAKACILPLPSDYQYTDALIARDLVTAVLGGLLAFTYVKICTTLAARNILESRDSRKIIHTFSAPLFMVIFPFFTPAGRFFATCIPLVNTLRLYLAASGDIGESDLAKAVSRSGDKKEALGGPFVYVLVVLASTLLFWRDTLIGITAMSTMAAGDGMADLVGRRFGKGNKWPFAPDKSIAGSTAFWLAATASTSALAAWWSYAGCLVLPFEMAQLIPRIAALTAACALIELLPIGNDNWTVPLGAAILAAIFLT